MVWREWRNYFFAGFLFNSNTNHRHYLVYAFECVQLCPESEYTNLCRIWSFIVIIIHTFDDELDIDRHPVHAHKSAYTNRWHRLSAIHS